MRAVFQRLAEGGVRRGVVLAVAWLIAALAGCRAPAPAVVEERMTEQQARCAQAESQLRSADAAVRLQAAVALLSMDYEPALEAVLKAMGPAEEPGVRVSMIGAASFCREHRCFGAVLEAAGDPDPDVRREAAAALARFTRPDEIGAMTELVKEPDTTASQRQLLFSALGEALAVQAVPVLLAGLDDSDEASRTAALEALRKISRRQLPLDLDQWKEWWAANSHKTREDVLQEHLQAFCEELTLRAEQMKDLTEQHDELMRLVTSAQSETPGLLLTALASRHASVRYYSACRLATFGKEALKGLNLDEKSCAALRAALVDPAAQVRQNVIRFVVQLEGDLRDELVTKALNDEDPAVLTAAIEAVRAHVGPEAIGRLEQLLAESPSREVREAAANALGKVGSDKSVRVLMRALDDREENVRWFAVEGLRKLGAIQAVPKISEMLEKDESARVREIAASTLGELGQPAGVPALRAALADRSDRVRERAASALLALATGNYERMMVIAASFREQGLLEPAEQVLARVVQQHGNAQEMKGRLMQAYEQLAEVQKQRGQYSAAAETYVKLEELAGATPRFRSALLNCWVQAGDAQRVVSAVEKWLAEAPPEQKAALLDLALGGAELLYDSGRSPEAAAVLELAVKAAGEQPEERITSRVEKLRRRISG